MVAATHKGPGFKYQYAVTLVLAFLSVIIPILVLDAAPASGDSLPLNVGADFYGINAERPYEDVYNSDILATNDEYSNSYRIEATVRIHETAAAGGSAGIIVRSDDAGEKFYYFGIYPNEDKWRLYKPDLTDPVEGEYPIELDPQSYNLKVTSTGSLLTFFINGVQVGSCNDASRISGRAGLRIKSSDTQFSNVRINDDPQDLSGWGAAHTVAWSGIAGGSARGNVILDRALLAGSELSPELDARFRMMEAMGARYVRFKLSWAESQPQSSSQPYSWLYADAFAIAAHRYNLEIVPIIMSAPGWAVKSEFRGRMYYQAYPPVDDNGIFDTTRFSQFSAAAAGRYKRGGTLATLLNWSFESYGQADYFEVGPEFNMGVIYELKSGQWKPFNAGWLGDLSQFVDLLKAGHDGIKSTCPNCLVLNGAAADDTITNYFIGNNQGRNDGYVPYLDSSRLHNPDGTLAWRQTAWQGVGDLYDEIESRPAPDNDPDRYFDILNFHTFMWKGFTAEWPVTVDRYVNCSYYSSQCWAAWYEKRFQEVVRVMNEHNDNAREVWMSETGFPSARPANDNLGFLGFLSEYRQSQALQTVYSEAAKFPAVKKVFWWQAYDSQYTGNLGLVREDASAKASYVRYGRMTGKTLASRSIYNFSWYDNVGGDNWILMANSLSATSDAWFDITVMGIESDLNDYNGGQVMAGLSVAPRYNGLIGGPVEVGAQSDGRVLVSQRTLWPKGGNSLEEVLGTEDSKQSDHYYWTWYDNKSPGMFDWVMVSNPGIATIYYRIKIGGVEPTGPQTLEGTATGSIAPGLSANARFNLKGGPVEVETCQAAFVDDNTPCTSPAKSIASQRVLTNMGTASEAFNEVPGVPAGELSNDYLWAWYDNLSAEAYDWVLVANPNAYTINYRITIKGALASPIIEGAATGSIDAGKNITPRFSAINGPLEVKTCKADFVGDTCPDATVAEGQSIASQRTIWGPSFEEVPGYPKTALASDYHWTWYDQLDAGTYDWVHIINTNTDPAETVQYSITVGGVAPSPVVEGIASGTIAPGELVHPRFLKRGGPVEVKAWLAGSDYATSPRKVMTSQRVLWHGYFNEVLGTVLS
jgi:hypothetical protein